MNLSELNRLLEPLRNRVRLLVARALIPATNSEGGKQFSLSLNLGFDELRRGIELVQQYGISSRPTPGSQAVALFVAGSRDSGVVVATKGQGPDMGFQLAEGEIALHTDEGVSIHLKRGGKIVIIAPTDVEIQTPKVTMSGDLAVAGNIRAEGYVQAVGDLFDTLGPVSSLRLSHNTHTHVGATWIGTPAPPDLMQPPPPLPL